MKFKVGDWIRTKKDSQFFGEFTYQISAAYEEGGLPVYEFAHQEHRQQFDADRIDEYYELVTQK